MQPAIYPENETGLSSTDSKEAESREREIGCCNVDPGSNLAPMTPCLGGGTMAQPRKDQESLRRAESSSSGRTEKAQVQTLNQFWSTGNI